MKNFLNVLMVLSILLFLVLLGCPVKAGGSGDSGSSGGGGGGTETGTLNFTIVFSEAMDTASVAGAMSISPNDPAFVPADLVWSDGDTKLSYSKAGYDKSLTYTVTVDAEIAEDINGNKLDGDGDGTGGEADEDDCVFSN